MSDWHPILKMMPSNALESSPVGERKFIPLPRSSPPGAGIRPRNFAPLEDLLDSDPIRRALARLSGYR